MELEINHTINDYVSDSWNYTYLDNRGIPVGFDHLVQLPFSPRHTVNYLLTVKPATRWKIDSTARYEDDRYSGNDQTGTKMGSQIVWGMRLSYQLRQLEAFLGVDDITNMRYEEQPGLPLPGRTVYFGIHLKLWD